MRGPPSPGAGAGAGALHFGGWSPRVAEEGMRSGCHLERRLRPGAGVAVAHRGFSGQESLRRPGRLETGAARVPVPPALSGAQGACPFSAAGAPGSEPGPAGPALPALRVVNIPSLAVLTRRPSLGCRRCLRRVQKPLSCRPRSLLPGSPAPPRPLGWLGLRAE